jgi:hypothetical protein
MGDEGLRFQLEKPLPGQLGLSARQTKSQLTELRERTGDPLGSEFCGVHGEVHVGA